MPIEKEKEQEKHLSKDKNELKDTVDFVRKNLSVKDINNNDMLIGVLDVDTIKMKTE